MMVQQPAVPIWVYIKVEVTTDGGLNGHYWLAKQHHVPFLGVELDYRRWTRETVVVDRILQDPETGELRGFQEAWFSLGVGEMAIWEHCGWQRQNMTEEEIKSNK